MAENIEGPPRHSPFKEFVAKVSIAGLQEAFDSHIRAVQYMFRITMIITFAAMGYETYAIIAQSIEESAILTTLKIIDNNPPFPGVTICYPASLNEKYVEKITSPIFENEKQVIDYMKKHNLHQEDAAELLRKTFAMNVTLEDTQTATYRLTKMVIQKVLEQSLKDGNSFWSIPIMPCDSTLQNCSVNGENFDCCEVAQLMFKMPFGTCYHIPSNNVSNENQTHKSNQSLDNVMLLNVSMNWSYGLFEDGIASDGFQIYINTLPSWSKIPIFVPSGMDASVVMAEPKKVNEISDCIPNDQAPKLKYFQDYDPEGGQCILEAYTENTWKYFACMAPAGFYIPENGTCSFEAVFSIFVGVTSSASESAATNTPYHKKAEAEAIEMISMLGSRKSPCKPLCSRWAYPSMSTSYAAIYDRTGHEANSSSTSWSLIKIIMPYKSFMVESEQKTSRWYMAMRNVGSMMAVYAGFSAITFAEIAFYGMKLILSKRRNVIALTVGPTASLVCAIAKENAMMSTKL